MDLLSAIETLTSNVKLKQLTLAYEELSSRYRSFSGSYMSTPLHRLAYLQARMPATFAVLKKVLSDAADLKIESVLDVGAGPGTGVWAAQAVFWGLKQATLLEKDNHLIDLGKQLAKAGSNSFLEKSRWVPYDIEKKGAFTPHDLTLASYVIGELQTNTLEPFIQNLWEKTNKILVVVEPGTPRGFSLVQTARDFLIGKGAFILSPCPHSQKCPMSSSDWCHFSVRLDRTSSHRKTKLATLSYEDEKFSYIIASKNPTNPVNARILRHPIKRKVM